MTKSRLIKRIVLTGLIAGTLDILAAIFLLAGGNAARVFRYIASGAFGKAAFSGGGEMVALGVFFHYFIALTWTVLYFFSYPKVMFLQRNRWISGAAYGMLVWAVMNLLVLPLSNIAPRNLTAANAVINILILVVCIGLPIALSANDFYRNVTGPSSGE